MNENITTECKEPNRQKPTKKVPKYLKYVAKKSKAGFGKVHEELYRIFSQSLGTTDKSISQVKSTDHSFISYLPDGRSSTSSKSEFDALSEELDMIKLENQALHDNGICSAAAFGKDKNKFKLNNRFSMPHLELTCSDEQIYTNDRVLRVEHFTSVSEKKEGEAKEDQSEIYIVPELKYKPQTCYELDDYVNLRAPCQPLQDMFDAKKTIKPESTKIVKLSGSPEPFDKNTVSIKPRKIPKRPPLLKVNKETPVDNNDDEDNDYLPPSQWTQSCYEPSATGKYISTFYTTVSKKQVPTGDKPFKTAIATSNAEFRTELKEEMGTDTDHSCYVPPSKWIDVDCEAVAENKTTPFYGNVESKSSLGDFR